MKNLRLKILLILYVLMVFSEMNLEERGVFIVWGIMNPPELLVHFGSSLHY